MIKKTITILTMSILLCSCGNIETNIANQTEADTTGNVTTIPNSEYLDTSDITYSGVFPMDFKVGYDVEDDSGHTIAENFDEYISPDGETFVFDEHKRLRYYFNHNLKDDTTEALSDDEMQTVCDNVLSDFIDSYENYECEDTIIAESESIAYTSIMRYETDSVNYGANVALTPSGKIRYMNIFYRQKADESQIDHEYFNSELEKKLNEIKEHHTVNRYEIETEEYYIKDNAVFGLYKVCIYTDPITDDDKEEISFAETFSFAKSLE